MEDNWETNSPTLPRPPSDGRNPFVLIVGAGMSGLLLAILLDRAGIPYEIYERATEAKPLGSIISLSANIQPIFEQLGLYDELLAACIPASTFEIVNAKLDLIALFGADDIEAVVGYRRLNFSRPRLTNFLLSKVPPHKIHFGKKIQDMKQNSDGVMIRCTDGSIYHGDILVGADGSYSAVRQALYSQMNKIKILPTNDALDLNKGYASLVGTTAPLDPVKFPIVTVKDSGGILIIGDNSSYVWGLFSIGDNRIAWNVISQIATNADFEDARLKNADWSPEVRKDLAELVRDFKVPASYGGTLGALIDGTPSESVSQVFLEDKMFETWHHGRTVLIGDAAHKLIPSSGQGAVNAMEDAVILANCLYDIGTTSPKDIEAALKSFKDQRLPHVIEQYNASQASAKFLFGHTFFERCIRYAIFNWIPKWKMNEMLQKDAAYRPQATFLPLVHKRGVGSVEPQFPNKRYESEQKGTFVVSL